MLTDTLLVVLHLPTVTTLLISIFSASKEGEREREGTEGERRHKQTTETK